MSHGSSPRHARKPKKARAKKPARSAASRDDTPDGRPPRGRYSKTMPERASDKPSRKASATPAPKPSAARGRKSSASGGRSAKPSDAGAQRLQKLLAAAGFGSRRDVEQFLVEERVTVNGRVASLGDKADPLVDEIRVDGERLARDKPAYWIVNKPRGVITTVRDNEGRRTVMNLLPPKVGRLFPVGRLDLETSGLLLMTNDGDVAHALLHPSLGNEREYRVNVKGELDAKAIGRLERGVSLDEGKTARAQVEDVRYDPDSHTTSLSLTLVEGKKRQIRRSLLVLGFPVRRLVRVRMGPLRIGRLPVGESRALRPEERRALLEHVRRLRAGEPVAAAARSGSGRDDLAAPPRKSGARRPAKKKAGARRSPPSGPRAAKSDGRRSPPSGPKATSSPTRRSPPSGPKATSSSVRRSPPSSPKAMTSAARRSPPSGPRAQAARGERAGPAGPRKKAARKKSAAARPSARRAPKKAARKKAARKKAGATRRPSKGAARKRPGTKPRGRPGPRGRR
ncbi:MAG: pseudouridine synthase [bacterium]|nr:pseudouridine synthase [bacterium]